MYKSIYHSPIGNIILAANDEMIVGLWFEGQTNIPEDVLSMVDNSDMKIFDSVKYWLDEYFSGHNPSLSRLNFSLKGSEFRQMVWKHLLKIPYGEVTTYGDLAKSVAKDMGKSCMSAQAIGGAVGANPIAIIVPCHRVLGCNGALTGYAGGIDKKFALLKLERNI